MNAVIKKMNCDADGVGWLSEGSVQNPYRNSCLKNKSYRLSVGAQLAISDPSRTPETLLGEVIKVEKIYTFKLTMGFEVSGSLRY